AGIKPYDVESLGTVQPERLRARAFFELQRQHAHPDQVRAVNALEALRDDGAHAQQFSPLRRPIARATRAVLLPGDDHQRDAARLVTYRTVEDANLLAPRLIDRHAAFTARTHQVLDPHVGESAARHHAVVAAPRAVAVEVRRLDSALLQIQARGR